MTIVIHAYIPSTNQTLIINFNFVFVGDVTMLKTYYSESSTEALKNIMTKEHFWIGLMSSLNIFALSSVVLTFVIRLVRLGLIYKTKKDVETA